jgi:hypothetical protein
MRDLTDLAKRAEMKTDPTWEPTVLAILNLADTLLRSAFASQVRPW